MSVKWNDSRYSSFSRSCRRYQRKVSRLARPAAACARSPVPTVLAGHWASAGACPAGDRSRLRLMVMSTALPLLLEEAQHDVAFHLVEKLLAFVDVIVGARVRPAHDRHHELAIARPDLRVAHRRPEQVAVLVDPLLEIDRRQRSCCQVTHRRDARNSMAMGGRQARRSRRWCGRATAFS